MTTRRKISRKAKASKSKASKSKANANVPGIDATARGHAALPLAVKLTEEDFAKLENVALEAENINLKMQALRQQAVTLGQRRDGLFIEIMGRHAVPVEQVGLYTLDPEQRAFIRGQPQPQPQPQPPSQNVGE